MTLIAVLALVATSGLIVALAPLALALGHWQVRHPSLALFAWKAAIVLGLASLFSGVAFAIVAAVDGVSRPGAEQVALTVIAWLSLFGIAGAVATWAATAESWGGDREPPIVIGLQRPITVGGTPVLVVPSETPFATSLAGRDGFIAVSEALVALLSERQLAAVVAHERAHLDERHHLLREVAALQAVSVPWLPAATKFERASRLLIELVADEIAAREVGRANIANALVRMSAATADESLDLRAQLIAARTTRKRLLPGGGGLVTTPRAR